MFYPKCILIIRLARACAGFLFVLFGDRLLCFAKIDVTFFCTATNFLFTRTIYILRYDLLQFLLFSELGLLRLDGCICNNIVKNQIKSNTQSHPKLFRCIFCVYLLARRVNALPFCFCFCF